MVSLQHDQNTLSSGNESVRIKLPEPVYDSTTSIEKALMNRRSIRDYRDEPLTLAEVSQLLWAAQGITDPEGYRTAPSAGALYPLELSVVTGNVIDLKKGIYRYIPQKHELIMSMEGDVRNKLSGAALEQSCVRNGAVIFVFSAVYNRTTRRYGERGIQYVHMEAGHAAQNICRQAVSLHLGTVVIGAFHDNDVKKIMNMGDNEQPLYLLPVGRR